MENASYPAHVDERLAALEIHIPSQTDSDNKFDLVVSAWFGRVKKHFLVENRLTHYKIEDGKKTPLTSIRTNEKSIEFGIKESRYICLGERW